MWSRAIAWTEPRRLGSSSSGVGAQRLDLSEAKAMRSRTIAATSSSRGSRFAIGAIATACMFMIASTAATERLPRLIGSLGM
jgi:hypothetical protein